MSKRLMEKYDNDKAKWSDEKDKLQKVYLSFSLH